MKNKLVSFALLLGLVVAGVSCKKDTPQPTAEFTITPTSLPLSVNGIGTITASNATGDVTWTIADNTIAEITPNGATCSVKAMKVGTTAVKAANNGKELTCTITVTDTPTPPTPTDHPDVAGTAGKYTIVFHAPAVDCNYNKIPLYGDFQGNNAEDPDAPMAELVIQEGYSNWYKIVFESADPSNAKGKICPYAADGSNNKWDSEGKDLTLIDGDGEIIDDFGTKNKIVCNEGSLGGVVYVNVDHWGKNVCDAPNPEGTATFNVVVLKDVIDIDPDDVEVSAAIADAWTAGSVEMVRDLGYAGPGLKFTGTYDSYPANSAFKYNIRYKGGDWIWEKGDNRNMPYSLVTNDEVSTWDSEPWNPIPGGNGTFTITFEGDCYEGANTEVVFTGNFSEESWEYSNRIMTPSNGNQFTWTGEFPDNFEYKVIVREKDSEMETWTWIGDNGANWKFDGSTYEQTGSCPTPQP